MRQSEEARIVVETLVSLALVKQHHQGEELEKNVLVQLNVVLGVSVEVGESLAHVVLFAELIVAGQVADQKAIQVE